MHTNFQSKYFGLAFIALAFIALALAACGGGAIALLRQLVMSLNMLGPGKQVVLQMRAL